MCVYWILQKSSGMLLGGPLSQWKQMEELCNNKENLAVSLLTYPI